MILSLLRQQTSLGEARRFRLSAKRPHAEVYEPRLRNLTETMVFIVNNGPEYSH